MRRRSDKASLLSSKGGDLLAELKNKLAKAAPTPKAPARPRPARASIEEELEAAFAHRGGPPLVRKRRPPVKKEPNKELIVIADPVLRRQAIAAAKAITPSASHPSSRQALHNDLGEAAFNKLARLRTSLEGFSATHIAGRGGNRDDDEIVRRRITKGAELVEQVLDPDDGYFLGYDFGTSTTKVVARYPYAGTDLAFAV